MLSLQFNLFYTDRKNWYENMGTREKDKTSKFISKWENLSKLFKKTHVYNDAVTCHFYQIELCKIKEENIKKYGLCFII